eukprot:9234311-Lingulodinium_polyedra.AAC.1
MSWRARGARAVLRRVEATERAFDHVVVRRFQNAAQLCAQMRVLLFQRGAMRRFASAIARRAGGARARA